MRFIEEYKKEFVQTLTDIKLWFMNPLRNKRVTKSSMKMLVSTTIVAIVIYAVANTLIFITDSKEGSFAALNFIYLFGSGVFSFFWYMDLGDKPTQDDGE